MSTFTLAIGARYHDVSRKYRAGIGNVARHLTATDALTERQKAHEINNGNFTRSTRYIVNTGALPLTRTNTQATTLTSTPSRRRS
jgi:hypothetical protein